MGLEPPRPVSPVLLGASESGCNGTLEHLSKSEAQDLPQVTESHFPAWDPTLCIFKSPPGGSGACQSVQVSALNQEEHEKVKSLRKNKEVTSKSVGLKNLENTKCLLCAGYCGKCFYNLYLLIGVSESPYGEYYLLSLFYRWENWGSESFSCWPKVMQLVKRDRRESEPGQWENKKGKKRGTMGSEHEANLCQVPICILPGCAGLTETRLGTWGAWEWDQGTCREVHGMLAVKPAQMLPWHLRRHLTLGVMGSVVAPPKNMSKS